MIERYRGNRSNKDAYKDESCGFIFSTKPTWMIKKEEEDAKKALEEKEKLEKIEMKRYILLLLSYLPPNLPKRPPSLSNSKPSYPT